MTALIGRALPSVYVVSEAEWGASHVYEMFQQAGFKRFTPMSKTERPDLTCFLGGEDVSPKLYGEEQLKGTHINERRDRREIDTFEWAKGMPKVGICRGGQLLNVLSGGAMWQHVDNHTGTHLALDLTDHEYYEVTSTHHQMMIGGPNSDILVVAWEASKRLSAKQREQPSYDTEVLFYKTTNSLCFQPHPEYKPGDTRDLFFRHIHMRWEMGTHTPFNQRDNGKEDLC